MNIRETRTLQKALTRSVTGRALRKTSGRAKTEALLRVLAPFSMASELPTLPQMMPGKYVFKADVLARGGDLFLLDMGEPVPILDLAKKMVRLSGLSLRDAQHPQGDIEIVCTGLRPGEKLFEELLIDAESEPTAHQLIYRASERALPPQQLWPQIEELQSAVCEQNAEAALAVLAQLVPEWQQAAAIEYLGPTRYSETGAMG